MSVRSTLLISTLALALFHTVPALAQSDAGIAARMQRLENEIDTLNRALYRGEQPPPRAGGLPAAADTEVRLSQLEAALRDLTGRIEEQGHATRQIQERLDRVLSELDRRMVDVESQMRGVTGGTAPAAAAGYSDAGERPVPSWAGGQPPQPLGMKSIGTADPARAPRVAGSVVASDMGAAYDDPASADSVPTGNLGVLRNDPQTGAPSLPVAGDSPAAFYEQAFALLRDKHYESAGTAFADFLERWPQHELADNAKYWLGESWYVRNDFERAARLFAEAYQKNPKGPKGADNLLKLALSLNGMGKKEEACLTFAQLDKEYGAAATPVVARAAQEKTRIGCP